MARQKAMNIAYVVGDNLYLNITNRCPCACTFCIRFLADGAYGSDTLWLEHEPTLAEITDELEKWDIKSYNEVVFCGYGEPTERLDVLCETAQWLKAHGAKKIRLNTNGLADLIHGAPTAPHLAGCVDEVSVSLNAGTEQAYMDITRPRFGPGSFAAMQAYVLACKENVPQVKLTVVDVLPPQQLEAAKALAEKLGVPLRVRAYEK